MLEPGYTAERYAVEAVIGRGGMAVVYRVRHATLGTHHAMKVLSLGGPGVRERLMQEGRLQGQLRHPNIVAVTDVLEVGGNPALVLELVDGPTLDGWLDQDPTPPIAIAEAMFRAVVGAVHAAHQRGLVHRDLKPGNVLLAPSAGAPGGYVPKVTDFGLAKALADEGSSLQRTRSGVTMGTPAYMAPEQIRDARSVDQRADIFALGAILYELVCGAPAFAGADVLSILNAVATGAFQPPRAVIPAIPARFDACIRGCLAVERDARIPDCATLLHVLDGGEWTPSQPPTKSAANQTFIDDGAGDERPVPATPVRSAPSVGSNPSLAPPTSASAPRSTPSTPPTPVTVAPRRAMRRWLFAGALGFAAFGALATVCVITVVGGGLLYARHARDVELQTWLDGTGGSFDYEAATYQGNDIVLTGVSVPDTDGSKLLKAASVRIRTLGDRHKLAADVTGAQIRLDQRDGRVALPVATAAAFDHSGLKLSEVHLADANFDIASPDGTLRLHADAIDADEVTLGGAQGFGSAHLEGKQLRVEGVEPIVEADHFHLRDGALELQGATVWVRSRTDGLLDLPVVIADVVPVWLGGAHRDDGAGWWSVAPQNWPIPVNAVTVNSGHLRIIDRSNAVKAAEWDLVIERAAIGPAQGEAGSRLTPVSINGAINGGRVSFEGDVREDGMLRASVSMRNIPSNHFNPYWDPSLRKHHVRTASGTLTAQIDFTATASVIAASFEGDLEGVSFEGTDPSAPATLAAKRDVAITYEAAGDLANPRFLPVNATLQAIANAAFKPVGGASWQEHDAPTRLPYAAKPKPPAAAATPSPRPPTEPAPTESAPEPMAPAEAPAPTPPTEEPAAEKESRGTKTPADAINEAKRALQGFRKPRRFP
jgi:serine/threonine protein kinase